jgi:hypothetical protein
VQDGLTHETDEAVLAPQTGTLRHKKANRSEHSDDVAAYPDGTKPKQTSSNC